MKILMIGTLFVISLITFGISSNVIEARPLPETPSNLFMKMDNYGKASRPPPPTPRPSPPIHQLESLEHPLLEKSPPNPYSASA